MGYLKAELSLKSPYHISKHRQYELMHFCLQYPEWKAEYHDIYEAVGSIQRSEVAIVHEKGRPVEDLSERLMELRSAMEMVEKAADYTDRELREYIILAATKDVKYPALSTRYGVPCGKDLWYSTYRKFFWILSQMKGL